MSALDASSSPLTCQVCFNALPAAETVQFICSPSCPATLCPPCFQSHIRATLDQTNAGMLPRVRCPLCLVRLPKSAWRRHVTKDLITRFEQLCDYSCEFDAPCCANAAHTQLPQALRGPQPPLHRVLDAQFHPKLAALRSLVNEFVDYKISARRVVFCIEEMNDSAGYSEHYLEELLHIVAIRILDDERRATLVLSYFALHKRMTTRCCYAQFCFNCKRQWDYHHQLHPTGPCDAIDLTDSDMVECRSCRATLVKVEGCDSVLCPCGFAMHWRDELRFRDEVRLGVIPAGIDVYDVEGFFQWDQIRRYL